MKRYRTEYYRNKKREQMAKRRALLLDGKVCERCGFDDTRALQFHHRDGATKLGTVMSMLGGGWDRLMDEVAKCELICANCHAIEHSTGGRIG